MFYVAGIEGVLQPYDPETTPIAVAPQRTQSNSSDSDAAVYEGHTLPTSMGLAAGLHAVNIGRAGATMAYKIQEAGFSQEAKPPEAISQVGALSNIEKTDPDSKQSPERVHPIRKHDYHFQTPEKERKTAITAKDIMSSPVITLYEESSLTDALELFREKRFRHVPVVSASQQLVGILSDRNFIGAPPPVKAGGDEHKIKEKMTINILTARPETEIGKIAEIMISKRIGCLPILDEIGALTGIITRSDILRAIVNHAPIELWT